MAPLSSLSACPVMAFELRFQSLFHLGRGLCFPCDAQGQVDLDGLSDSARENYLFARGSVGYEFAAPRVCPRG